MFSSLRSRLWLSYALIIVTALGIVALVLFIYLLRNPLLYRQTIQRLKAVEAVVTPVAEAPAADVVPAQAPVAPAASATPA